MKLTCPVCGFDNINEPKLKWSICPSCGTQFGLSDSGRSYSELRKMWVQDKNATWQGPDFLRPPGWSAFEQLRKAGLSDIPTVFKLSGTGLNTASFIASGMGVAQWWTQEPIRANEASQSRFSGAGINTQRVEVSVSGDAYA